jgi:anti-sigma factor RsiW
MTPPCLVTAAELGRFRDGEMSAPEASSFRVHVDECPRCQVRLARADLLGELLRAHRAQMAEQLPANFTERIMSLLPARQPRRRWLAEIKAFVDARRTALAIGLLGAAVAAALTVVFLPSLRDGDDRAQEEAENEAQIHRIEVSSPDQTAVVLESAEGNTVIWMVPAGEAAGEPVAPPAAQANAEEDAGQGAPVR